MALTIKGKTQSLKWLNDLLAFFTAEQIKIPTAYRDQVIETKELLKKDTSGMVSSMLDFAIDCSLVKYRVETENENFTKILNSWLDSVNSDLRGKVPTKLKALAREYFRERWKGSSNLLLRTFWTTKDDFSLPTTMFFVDGEDIIIKNGNDDKTAPRKLGEEKYFLRLTSDNTEDPKQAMPLPSGNKNEIIFAQRPYESWSALKTTPYLIRRGLFRNIKLFNLLSSKSEFIIGKAIEYLFVMKKGTERMALDSTRPDYIYDAGDLKQVKTDLAKIIRDSKSETGAPTYTTGFDTEMEHLIPDYTKAISEALYSPIERRLLAGLGLIDIIQGTASTRRESLLNPKPFIAEVEQGINDFIALLEDIVETIKEKNSDKHRKYVNVKVEINHSPIPQFIDRYVKQMLRGIYDRGNLSRKTLTEVVGELDYELEVQRRKQEHKEGHDEIMKAPVIQNRGEQSSPDQDIDPDKTGPEAENFLVSLGFKPEETKNYIRFRQRSPKDFQEKSFRIITLSKSKGIKAVIGRLKGKTTTTVQSYLFVKTKWTVTKAKEWIKKHKGSIYELDKIVIDIDDIQNFAVDSDKEALQLANQQNDCISDYLNEISYKQKIIEQTYSYFKLALISKAVKEFINEDGWKCDDILNINNNTSQRTRPVFSKLSTSRVKTEELLIDGFYCLTKNENKLVVGIRPYFSSFGVAVYSNNFSKDLADNFIDGFETYASKNNFLKGEKITPQGKFLTIPEIQFEDIKLNDDKRQAIKIGVLEFFAKKDIYEKNKLPFKRGLIFAGEPGTGKTLMGKVLINQTQNTFIWVTAGDLLTNYGDIDSRAFGRLLSMAKELAPSILFAEDIDDYLQAKSSVDTIKTQMDGLDSMEGVVTILCTNYPERIPKSLIDRPSRFDDVVIFDLPDEGLRYEILDSHLKSVEIKNRIETLKTIAKNSEGLTGAHLKEIVIYSILLASDENRNEITKNDFNKALNKVKKTRVFIQTIENSLFEDSENIIDKEFLIEAKEFEQAPYKRNEDLPKSVKVLPSGGQSLWRRVFNQNYSKGEDYARRVAWFVVKKKYTKDKDGKWKKK